jgi:hypothetical protein
MLQDRKSKEVLHLSDEGPPGKSILVVKTVKISALPNKLRVRTIADNIRKGNQSSMLSTIDDDNDDDNPRMNEAEKVMMSKLTDKTKFDLSIMAFNIAKLSEEERSRLYVRRF